MTTTGGGADAIVWMAGAEGDNRLHGFRGDTGEPVFAGSDAMAGSASLRDDSCSPTTGPFIAGDNRVASTP